MMTKVLFIDKTDTLIRKNRKEQMEKSAKLLGVTPEEYRDAYHWVYIDYSLGKIKNDYDYYKLILKNLKRPPNRELIRKLHKIFMDCFESYPQSRKVLEELKKKYRLILLSNHVTSWVDELLERFKLKKYFEQIIISDEVEIRKPDLGIFRIALKKAGVRASESALIDDKADNVKAAQRLGIRGILVDPKWGIPKDVDKQLR